MEAREASASGAVGAGEGRSRKIVGTVNSAID